MVCFPAIRRPRFSHLASAYLSNWNPEVRPILESELILLTEASDVRVKQAPKEEVLKVDPFRCAKYVRYEGAMTVIGINIVGLMMLLRCARSRPRSS